MVGNQDDPLFGKRLGNKLAERRKTLGWTQDGVAERLGVDTETISRFERGVALPSLRTLTKLANVLNVPVADLLAETSNQPIDQAIILSAWLSELSESDRAFAVEIVKRCCEHLKQIG